MASHQYYITCKYVSVNKFGHRSRVRTRAGLLSFMQLTNLGSYNVQFSWFSRLCYCFLWRYFVLRTKQGDKWI